jgi:chemotaxis signal transduction protein
VKALSFKIGTDRFALPFHHIEQIVESPRLFPIPLAPSFFPGALNFHNHVIPVVDLAAYLDVCGRELDSRAIILDLRYHRMGLAVGPIEGKINLGEIRTLPPTPGSLLSAIARLVTLKDGSPVRLLEPADLKSCLTSSVLTEKCGRFFSAPADRTVRSVRSPYT